MAQKANTEQKIPKPRAIIFAIFNSEGERIFNVITNTASTKVTVEGMPGATVKKSRFSKRDFAQIPVKQFVGQRASLVIGGKPFGCVDHHRSTSRFGLDKIDALTVRFSPIPE